jgi:predicted DNA-binding transcriptional regulator AlpA
VSHNQRRRRATEFIVPRYIDVRAVAARLDISVPSVWRGVALKRLPSPSYPTPGAARWDVEDLDRAMAAAKALPRDNLARRRAARLAARQTVDADAGDAA